MKRCILLALLLSTTAAIAQVAEQKIAVISLGAVIRSHPDVKPNEDVLEGQRLDFETEGKEQIKKLRSMKAAFDEVRKEVENRALSEAARAENYKAAQDKYVELRDFEKELRELQLERQRSLHDLRLRMRKRIIDKIKVIVEAYCARNGIDIVLNAETGEPVQVLYHADTVDISEDIVKLVIEGTSNGKE